MEIYLLSICIPTYNRSLLLNGLLENIIVEIYRDGHEKDVQIIVVDGHSSDNTFEIIESKKQLLNIKYYRRDNREGIDKDIVKCIELADGKYCWLFSDDDRINKGAIRYLMNILKENNDLAGCFCNRISYDYYLQNKVAEIKDWPAKRLKIDCILSCKDECFKYIGMDFGFISSQIINKSKWQDIIQNENLDEFYGCYYLMVHIIGRMMDNKFKWFYINRPMLIQRTGNDSLLTRTGVIERQIIEHSSFEKIIKHHYDTSSIMYKSFFRKMVYRLPRVIANLKSQNINYKTQLSLFKLYYFKYKQYPEFWFKVIPIFIMPNYIYYLIRKIYFKYIISLNKQALDVK